MDLWHALLGVIAANSNDSEKARKTALDMVQAAQKGSLPGYLRPKRNELDNVVGNLLGGVLARSAGASASDLEVVRAILCFHGAYPPA